MSAYVLQFYIVIRHILLSMMGNRLFSSYASGLAHIVRQDYNDYITKIQVLLPLPALAHNRQSTTHNSQLHSTQEFQSIQRRRGSLPNNNGVHALTYAESREQSHDNPQQHTSYIIPPRASYIYFPNLALTLGISTNYTPLLQQRLPPLIHGIFNKQRL